MWLRIVDDGLQLTAARGERPDQKGPNPQRLIPHHQSVLLLALALLAGGCSQRLQPIFDEQRRALAWPPAPAPARIHYVGQLRSSADLKPPTKPFQRIGELFAGAAEPQGLYGPRSVACTPDGSRVWVADPGGRCLHLFDLSGRTYRKISRVGDHPLLSPVGLCLGPDDSLYVCDSEDVAIHRLEAATGTLLASLRLPEEIGRPVALSYRASTGELFVVDSQAHDIKVLAGDGALRRVIGRRGARPGEFNFPCDIADGGRLIWIADAGNQRVQGLTCTGEPVVVFGQAGDAPGDLALPKGVALDSDGHVYVVDARFENVQIFDQTGRLLLAFGQEGVDAGEFWLPAGIFIDHNDRIWVCDLYNRRVQVFDYLKLPDEHEGRRDSDVPAEDR